jgi:hypothetical protein
MPARQHYEPATDIKAAAADHRTLSGFVLNAVANALKD